MNARQFLALLGSWKLTFDSPWLLERASALDLDGQSWFRRFFRFTPELLERIRHGRHDDDRACELFAKAVSWFRFGRIFKLTSRARTRLADEAVRSLRGVSARPSLMEAGVSDGSAAIELMEERELFSRVALTDRFNVFLRRRGPLGATYHDADGQATCFRLGILSFDLRPLARRETRPMERIETVNPLLERRHGLRAIDRFDIFSDASKEPFEIIKCSNLLNTNYFSDDKLRRAVCNLARSLREGGHLVISQNHESYAGGEAVFVLRKTASGLEVVMERNNHGALRLFDARERR
jgi:hypothetical protein